MIRYTISFPLSSGGNSFLPWLVRCYCILIRLAAAAVNAFVASIQSSSFHWHYEYELLAVLKGSITVRVNSRVLVLKKNDIILINSKVVHEIQCEQGDNLCMVLQLDPALFKNEKGESVFYRFYLNSVTDELPVKGGYLHFVRRAAGIVLGSLKKDEKTYYRVRAEVYALIADLFEYAEYDMSIQTEQSDHDITLLMDIIDYLREHVEDRGKTENQLQPHPFHYFSIRTPLLPASPSSPNLPKP